MSNNMKMTPAGKLLHVVVTGMLTKADYDAFVLQAEQQIQDHGKICVLSELHNFRGWTPEAMWEDFKFAFRHRDDYERLAIVGTTL